MFSKQVDGVKFREIKGKKMEITFPATPKYRDYYNPRIVPFEKGMEMFKVLYATKYADKVFDSVLKELGINLKTAHLLTDRDVLRKDGKVLTHYYAGTRQTVTTSEAIFDEYMENALRKKGVDLAYLKADTEKYHLHIGGNAGGITWTYRKFLFDSAWQDWEVSKDELGKYIKSHKNVRIFEETREMKQEVSREQLLTTKFGTESNHRGYGSQASIAISKVQLKRDRKGNLLITRSLEIWD